MTCSIIKQGMTKDHPHEKWNDGYKDYTMGWRNWCGGQPDNSDNDNKGLGVFAYWGLSSNNYCWDDFQPVSESLGYVCEKDKRKGNV